VVPFAFDKNVGPDADPETHLIKFNYSLTISNLLNSYKRNGTELG
jgi:hypothetical protein